MPNPVFYAHDAHPNDHNPSPDRGETLTERAYDKLEELIVTLQLPPGEILSEVTLKQLQSCSSWGRKRRRNVARVS